MIDDRILNLARLESVIEAALSRWEVPGLSLAIVKDGETVFCGGYGVRSADKPGLVDQHTLFPIVGATQSITAAAVAILVGERKLRWDDRLIDLLPGFRTVDDYATRHLTVLDALSHRTGLSSEPLSYMPHPDRTRAEIVRSIADLPFVGAFRSGLHCSLHPIVAVGEIIPALTGVSWDDFICERLFRPLGMTGSITGPDCLAGRDNAAAPHELVADESSERRLKPLPYTNNVNVGPAEAVFSNAADMIRWLRFQLDDGKLDGEEILPSSEIAMLRRCFTPASAPVPGLSRNFLCHGLGLYVSDSTTGYRVYSHGGDIEGFESYHAFVPELRLGVAAMVNCAKTAPQALVTWIIDRYSGAPERDWINEMTPASVDFCERLVADQVDRRHAITRPEHQPSHSLSAYAGCYRHPAAGTLRIDVNEDGDVAPLSFRLGTLYEGVFHHAHHDVFFAETKAPYRGRFFFHGPAQFTLSVDGAICAVEVLEKLFERVEIDDADTENCQNRGSR